MATELHNPEVVCQECGQNIIIPQIPTLMPEEGQPRAQWIAQQWDQITPELTRRGWVVLRNELGGRFALCKPCSIKTAPEVQPLPEFAAPAKCVMCGHRQAAVRFCDGKSRGCGVGHRNHVHRTCERCGFSWPELPRSESNERTAKRGRNPQAGSDSDTDRVATDRNQTPQAALEVV